MTSPTYRTILLCLLSGGLLTALVGGCVTKDSELCDDEPDHPACRDAGGVVDGGMDAGEPEPCDGACGGETPVCNEATDTCVACLEASDCTDPAAPFCSEDNECVECLEDAQCTEADAAQCDTETHTCVPCDTNAACDGIDGLGVCGEGTCVECTAGEPGACGDNVCNSLTNECTTTPAGMTGLCQECVSDAQCRDGMKCVPMTFDETDVGYFCLWEQDAPEGPDGDCFSVPTFAGRLEETSIDGTETTYCGLRATTCPALQDFNDQSCDMVGTFDEACGVPGLDDGFCVMAGAQKRCTVPCVGSDDCRLDCDTSKSPPLCTL